MKRSLSIVAAFAFAALLSACCGTCIKDPPCKPGQENCCNQPNPCAAPCDPCAPMAPMPPPPPPPVMPAK
jgi:hypothetical protein